MGNTTGTAGRKNEDLGGKHARDVDKQIEGQDRRVVIWKIEGRRREESDACVPRFAL